MKWTKNLAYAVGLITTDGNLSKDGRHIELTSKDLEQIENLKKSLRLSNKIGTKGSSFSPGKKYYRIQFGNVKLYRFLLDIGLTPNKTKTIGKLRIPDRYFPDFLRGHLDGDGYTTSFQDSIWKDSFRFYTGFTSASKIHLDWLQNQIKRLYNLEGTINCSTRAIFQLKFSKKASVKLLGVLYYKSNLLCLERKRSKISKALDIIRRQAEVVKLVYTLP